MYLKKINKITLKKFYKNHQQLHFIIRENMMKRKIKLNNKKFNRELTDKL